MRLEIVSDHDNYPIYPSKCRAHIPNNDSPVIFILCTHLSNQNKLVINENIFVRQDTTKKYTSLAPYLYYSKFDEESCEDKGADISFHNFDTPLSRFSS